MLKFSAHFPPLKLLLLFLITGLMDYYYMGVLSFGLPQFQTRFHISENEIGPFIAILRIGLIPAVVITFFVDFIGRKPVILFSKSMLIICSVISGLTKSKIVFAVTQLIGFMFIGAETSIVFVIVSEMSMQNRKALTLSVLTGFSAIGTGCAVFVYGINSYFNLPVQFAYFFIVPLLLLVLFFQSSMKDQRMIRLKAHNGLADSLRINIIKWWEVMRQSTRRMIYISLISFLFDATIVPAFFFASTYLQHSHGFKPQDVSMLIIFSGSIATLITIAIGHLSDQVGHKRVLVFMMLATAASIISFYNAHGVALYVSWLIFILSSAAVSNIYVTIYAEIFHVNNRVSAMGIRGMFSTLGAFAGLILQGSIFTHTHSNSTAICLITGSIVIGILLTCFYIPGAYRKTGLADTNNNTVPDQTT